MRRSRRRARSKAGLAALEFALLAPAFVVVAAGVTDVGFAIYYRTSLEANVAAAANEALLNGAQVTSDPTTLANTVASVATTSNTITGANGATIYPNGVVTVNNGPTVTVTGGSSTSSSSSGTAANASLYYCPTGSPPNWNWGSSVAAGTSCTGGGTAGRFVTITVSYSYTPFFPGYNFVQNGSITAGALVQTQ